MKQCKLLKQLACKNIICKKNEEEEENYSECDDCDDEYSHMKREDLIKLIKSLQSNYNKKENEPKRNKKLQKKDFSSEEDDYSEIVPPEPLFHPKLLPTEQQKKRSMSPPAKIEEKMKFSGNDVNQKNTVKKSKVNQSPPVVKERTLAPKNKGRKSNPQYSHLVSEYAVGHITSFVPLYNISLCI